MSDLLFEQASLGNMKGSMVRRPDTGCVVCLGAGLTPVGFRHTKKCKCVPVDSPQQLERLTGSISDAMSMDIMASEKPSVSFAMLLLGGEVVFSSETE
ncbi:hypothetical protein F5Y04DRAFT_240921 [Hypomontagnella monticulosa]|nr:hypothetical protein F5Y04DRAFT_240921 [Hypomontagnella monticulosa]